MIQFCQGEPICERCGQKTHGKFRRRCKVNPPPIGKPVKCPYLLGPTAESTLLYGCGCESERKNGIDVTVWDCLLHGRCVTHELGTHLSDESIVRCVVCPDNPANQNQSGGGEIVP